MPVVLVQPLGKRLLSLVRAVVGASIGPLPQRCLDQPFGFSVGAWRVGPCAQVTQAQASQESAEPPAPVAGAVVGHHPGEGNAEIAVVAQRLQQCAAGTGATFIVLNGAEGHPGVIVDSQVNELPARAIGSPLAIAGDAMAGTP